MWEYHAANSTVDLLKQYEDSLRETRKLLKKVKSEIAPLEQIIRKPETKKSDLLFAKRKLEPLLHDKSIVASWERNLLFCIEWMKTARCPDAGFRGIERNDAYYVQRPYDPSIVERYMENLQANAPFSDIDESFVNEEEREEYERIRFEDSLSTEEAILIDKVKFRLTKYELDILLLNSQDKSQREIANFMNCSQTSICKAIKKIKRKLKDLGIEREDL